MVNINATKPEELVTNLAAEAPYFWPGALAFLFLVFTAATYFAQERRFGGRASFPGSLLVAGMITTVLGMILLLVDNLVDLYTIGVLFAITIGAAIWTGFSSLD